jgi:hypothetical protein
MTVRNISQCNTNNHLPSLITLIPLNATEHNEMVLASPPPPAIPSSPPKNHRIIQPLNPKKSLQPLDPLNPRPHLGIRLQRDIAHRRQRNINKNTQIRNRRTTQRQPLFRRKLLLQHSQRFVAADRAFLEKDVK